MSAYYNEHDPYAAQWLRNLIAKGLIADGEVDERSIVDVRPAELTGFVQCHFFAGIGGWSLAARVAGWRDDRRLWTGSCPCQPFSAAGKQEGQSDERHLWPVFFGLIAACRPDVVMGEQVAAAVGKDWLDGVHSDLESIGYACGAAVVPACAVDAPHRRDRLWFVADAASVGGRAGDGDGGDQPGRLDTQQNGSVAEASSSLPNANQSSESEGWEQRSGKFSGPSRIASNWTGSDWAVGSDGKARRVKPGVRLLAHGVPARVGKLRAYGNAIVPQVAAEVISAYMESDLV